MMVLNLKLISFNVLSIQIHVKQAEGAEPAEPPPPPPEPPPGDLPYAMVAKAVVSGIVCLQQQLDAFSKLDASITGNYEIPEAIPLQVGSLFLYAGSILISFFVKQLQKM